MAGGGGRRDQMLGGIVSTFVQDVTGLFTLQHRPTGKQDSE